mgnify:FL=1
MAEEIKLNDQQIARRQKMDSLRTQGIDPFGHAFKRTHRSSDVKREFGEKTAEELDALTTEVKIAGRIMSKRRMGKLGFMHLKDRDGLIQVVVNKRIVGDDVYEIFKQSDLGDIVGITGRVIKTQSGELSIEAHTYEHLTKSLRPLPEKFHGLTDKEERYRRRYLDLIMNDESMKVAFMRPQILSAIRTFLGNRDFTEVETPVLTTLLTGASARPFVTHHNAQNLDMYLRIALELNLKRLLVGGMENVYEIGRTFRNEGMDAQHNPEFTLMELYQAYSNLEGMMELTESMYKYIADTVCHKRTFKYLGHEISLDGDWKRISMCDAIKEKTGIDFTQHYSFEEARSLAKEHGIEVEAHFTVGHIINAFFEKYVEETLIEPTFLYGHPIEISPLTKANPNDPRFVQRFELFISGHECANAYTELNDPIDQLNRFKDQLKAKELGDDEANDIDMDFIEALEYGMPPAGGIGYGIDRMVMLFSESESIRDVILFPTMKPLDSDKKVSKEVSAPAEAAQAAPVVEEKIDFSNVQIEPLFQDQVDFDTFSKSDFRAVKVKECEAVKKSKKLLKFVLDDGTGTDRVILSGIHEYYEPEELVGKTCIAITNLPPRAMMGIDSCGMLISAVHHENGEEKLHLLMVDPHIPAGAKLY